MTGELDPVTLLYRADWTRLSLTADVRGMLDYRLLARQNGAQGRILQSIPPGTTGVRHFRARLLVAPGGRYHAQADGDDDEFRPVLAPYRAAPAHAPDPDAHAPDPDEGVRTRLTTRYAEMLRPVNLLSGFALAFRGPTTFAGRDALHVVATPSAQAAAISPGLKPLDRIEVFVDAETGILLRREEIFEGQTLRFTELTSARFGPLEAGDAGHFPPDLAPDQAAPDQAAPDQAAPDQAASDIAAEDPGQEPFQDFSGAGWKAAKTAADAASGVVGTAIRLTPGGSGSSGSGNADDPEAAISADDPFPAAWGAEDAPSGPISDGLLHALIRGGSAAFAGAFHHWTDVSVLTGEIASAASRHGWTGASSAARALSERAAGAHEASLVRFGGGGRYRIDLLREVGKGHPTTTACDGERRWRVYPNRVTVGPAGPYSDDVLAAMVDASWLLRYELSGETELSYRGRPAYAVRVVAGDHPVLGPNKVMLSDARAIIDAELGIVLLFVSALGGRPAMRCELRDVTAGGDEDAAAFRVVPPPGTRVVPVSGNLLEEIDFPDAVRTAARAAEHGVTAAREFLGSLRGRR